MEKNEDGFSVLFPQRSASCRGEGRQLAMVYSPMQCWRMLYAPCDALVKGTLFEELYKPLEEETR